MTARTSCRVCGGGCRHESRMCSPCRRTIYGRRGVPPVDEPEVTRVAAPQLRGGRLVRFVEAHASATPGEVAASAGYSTVTRLAQVLARSGRADLGRALLTRERATT